MKVLLVIVFLFFISSTLSAQEKAEMSIIEGTLFDRDSIPIESAYLISYKTLRAFATDKDGHFEILLDTDDSLKIHHVAFKSIILKPEFKSTELKIVLQYEDNLIEEIDIQTGTKELKNLELNMSKVMEQLDEEFLSAHTKGPILNPYAPINPSAQTVGFNLFELIDWIKHQRKK